MKVAEEGKKGKKGIGLAEEASLNTTKFLRVYLRILEED